MKILFKRFLTWSNQQLLDIRNSNSGRWAWLNENPIPLASLNRSLWRGAEPGISYYLMLSLSVIIATLGLLANSTAVIIGAMIIAPLMGPILGIAFSMVISNRRMLRRSSLSLVTGVLLSILIAALISRIIGLETLTPEINARVSPTLIDLGVALAAGTAGAFAKSRRSIADALPGVAIAVALVPPLSVIGIGIALNLQNVTWGAMLLFLTNLIGIIFSGSLVFLVQRYGSITRAKQGLSLAMTALLLLGIPLGISFQDLAIQIRTRAEISRLIRTRTLTFSDKDIRNLTVQRQNDQLSVDLELTGFAGSVSARQVNLVREFLQQNLGQPVRLNVRLIPIEEFTSSPEAEMTVDP